jgi:hypothetical protein
VVQWPLRAQASFGIPATAIKHTKTDRGRGAFFKATGAKRKCVLYRYSADLFRPSQTFGRHRPSSKRLCGIPTGPILHLVNKHVVEGR